MFQIEKNIPAPLGSGEAGRKSLYPFAFMEVGDSFAAPRDMGKDKRGVCQRQNSIASCSRRWAKLHDPESKFATALVDENTVRCWRVK